LAAEGEENVSVRISTFVMAGLLVASPVRADSNSTAGDSSSSDAAMTAAAVLCSVVYLPVKVAYAAGGGIVAGLGYVLSGGDTQVVDPIIDASVRGDYFLLPDQLRGDRPIEFVGRSPENQALRAASEVSSAPAPASASAKDAKEAPGGGWN
jgi:hypothetical protein